MAESKFYEFHVDVTCSGCTGRIEKVLRRDVTVEDYQDDVAAKLVRVRVPADTPYERVLEVVSKPGKTVFSGKEIDDWNVEPAGEEPTAEEPKPEAQPAEGGIPTFLNPS